MPRIVIIFCFSLLTIEYSMGQNQYDCPGNFHIVEEKTLYRSSQFHRRHIDCFQHQEIGLVLNLRNRINNKFELKNSTIEGVRVRMRAKKIKVEDVVKALKIIKQSNKPVLVHCLHGSDRTGCIVACYRMVIQNWSREKAIQEFEMDQFGYNKGFFPNIKEFLESVDIDDLKRKVQ